MFHLCACERVLQSPPFFALATCCQSGLASFCPNACPKELADSFVVPYCHASLHCYRGSHYYLIVIPILTVNVITIVIVILILMLIVTIAIIVIVAPIVSAITILTPLCV